MPERIPVLFHESFDASYRFGMTNAAWLIPNYGTLVESWSGYALQRTGILTPFVTPGLNSAGLTNLASEGALRFWVRPYWSSAPDGKGPGQPATLTELAARGGKESVAVWWLQVNPEGTLLSLVSPGERGPEPLLKAEIRWQAGQWHQVCLNYGRKTVLAIDGVVVAEGGATVMIPPKVAVLAWGSTLSGTSSLGGELEELSALSRPLDTFQDMAFKTQAALGPISPEEDQALAERRAKWIAEREAAAALGGEGALRLLVGGASECITNVPGYITNIVSVFDTNQGWTVTFDIQGSHDGTSTALYDVFSTTNLVGDSITNSAWTWLERGPTCSTYQYTNQPGPQVFFVLGTPQDSDTDGLTDAFERLVSKSSPANPDTDGDGLSDGWEWEHFGHFDSEASKDPDGDWLTNLQEQQIGTDPNLADTDSDGVSDLLQDSDSDGLTDEHEVIRLETNPNNPDTDGDGWSDYDELYQGGDPKNALVMPKRRLGWWRFNDTTTWIGEQGQLPVSPSGLTGQPSWSGTAVQVTNTAGALLKYGETQTNGACNFKLHQGTIRFWFKPSWASGTLTGNGRLFEVGQEGNDWWCVRFANDGDQILFETQGDGISQTLLSAVVSLSEDQWYQITLTYSPTNSHFYLDGQLTATGSGVGHYPAAAVRAQGFTLGSDGSGGQQAQGAFDELETFNYLLSTNEVADAYNAMVIPTNFSFGFDPEFIQGNSAEAIVTLYGPPPARMAWVTNNSSLPPTNVSAWLPFATTFTVSGLSSDGRYKVWLGTKGIADDSPITWKLAEVIRDTVAPVLVVTNPTAVTVTVPTIQVKGLSPEPLVKITWSLSNTNETLTDQAGYVIDQAVDMHWEDWENTDFDYTTNWFQCFDVPLAEGTNAFSLTVEDRAGNVNTTNITFTLDYTTDTNAPTATLIWPQPGASVCGTNLTVRGRLNETCATITGSLDGGLTIVEGRVDRDGRFWIEGLPLGSGTTTVTLTMTDAANNTGTTSLNVTRSAVTVQFYPLDLISNPGMTTALNGELHGGDSNTVLFINGVQAGLADATWINGQGVPINFAGTVTLRASVYSNSDSLGEPGNEPGSDGTGSDPTGNNPVSPNLIGEFEFNQQQPTKVILTSYTMASDETSSAAWESNGQDEPRRVHKMNWELGKGGRGQKDAVWYYGEGYHDLTTFDWPGWGDGLAISTGGITNTSPQPPASWPIYPEEAKNYFHRWTDDSSGVLRWGIYRRNAKAEWTLYSGPRSLGGPSGRNAILVHLQATDLSQNELELDSAITLLAGEPITEKGLFINQVRVDGNKIRYIKAKPEVGRQLALAAQPGNLKKFAVKSKKPPVVTLNVALHRSFTNQSDKGQSVVTAISNAFARAETTILLDNEDKSHQLPDNAARIDPNNEADFDWQSYVKDDVPIYVNFNIIWAKPPEDSDPRNDLRYFPPEFDTNAFYDIRDEGSLTNLADYTIVPGHWAAGAELRVVNSIALNPPTLGETKIYHSMVVPKDATAETLIHEWLHFVGGVPHRGDRKWHGKFNPATDEVTGDPEAVMHWTETGGAQNEINRIERNMIPAELQPEN